MSGAARNSRNTKISTFQRVGTLFFSATIWTSRQLLSCFGGPSSEGEVELDP